MAGKTGETNFVDDGSGVLSVHVEPSLANGFHLCFSCYDKPKFAVKKSMLKHNTCMTMSIKLDITKLDFVAE